MPPNTAMTSKEKQLRILTGVRQTKVSRWQTSGVGRKCCDSKRRYAPFICGSCHGFLRADGGLGKKHSGSTRRGSSLSPTVGPQAGEVCGEDSPEETRRTERACCSMGGAGRIIYPKLQPGARS